jgi:diacylglycerol kinase (ATP)
MNDGWLDVVLYTNFSKSEYIRHAISISQGRRTLSPKIIYRQVKALRIRTNEAIEFHADGTVLGNTPAEIRVLPGALKVQVPKEPVPGLLTAKNERIQRHIKRGKTYV